MAPFVSMVMKPTGPLIRQFDDLEAVSGAAAEQFCRIARDAISARAQCTIVLAGGSTPHRLYEVLATPAYQTEVQWDRTEFFWGDERMVPSEHPDSNFQMANKALLSRIPVPQRNIHRIPTERGEPETVARKYEEEIAEVFRVRAGGQPPAFDLVLLGMGTDGHTASLFPNTDALNEASRWVAPNRGPLPHVDRVTMTARILQRLVKCGRCGAAMAYCWTRRQDRVYSYLRCSTEQKQGREACPTPTLSAPEVEAAIINEIKRMAQDPALVDQVFPEALEQTRQGREFLETERTRLLHQRQQGEEAIKRLVTTLESPTGELPEVVGERIKDRQAEVQRLNARLQTAEQELAALDAQTINREHLTQTLAQFTDLWDALYPQERVKLVHSLIESVIYHDETDHLEFHFKTSG